MYLTQEVDFERAILFETANHYSVHDNVYSEQFQNVSSPV